MTRKMTTTTPTLYGTTPAKGTLGADTWMGHDGSNTWSDAGASGEISGRYMDTLGAAIDQAITETQVQMTAEMQAEIARQVQEAVFEYVSSCEFELGVVDDEIVVAAVLKNDQAEVKAYVPLVEVLQKAQANATTDAKFINGLQMISHQLMGAITRTPAVAAKPARRSPPALPAPPATAARKFSGVTTSGDISLAHNAADGFGAPIMRRGSGQ